MVLCGFLFIAGTWLIAPDAIAHRVQIDLAWELNSGEMRVTSEPPGIDCPTDCSADFPEDTSVTLSAFPGPRTWFPGFSFKTNGEPSGLQGTLYLNDHLVNGRSVALADPFVEQMMFCLEARSETPGVSINDGDLFTNDPHVEVTLNWPRCSKYVSVSNDGGFGQAGKRNIVDELDWKLRSSGPERLPKTVYVKFGDISSWSPNFTDDIILDETDPVLSSVSAAGAGVSSVLGLRSFLPVEHARKVTLRIRARDRTSGVARMQVGPRPNRRLKKVRFRSRVRVSAPGRRLWVRVFDRAGNASRWKAVRLE